MIERHHIFIRGVVQGVGMRPFIYRLAHELNLNGHVSNNSDGINIEIEGPVESIKKFLKFIVDKKPKAAEFYEQRSLQIKCQGDSKFVVRESEISKHASATILPDFATCADCIREIFDEKERRYLYPFTNCTQCGPRFSILEKLPYDRKNTTLKDFALCDQCKSEYENPQDRRFHAQPIACPKCGPHLEFYDNKKKLISSHHEAIESAIQAIREGKILALKGVGGFQLIVDAHNYEAVMRLREKKHRPLKPFALMYPHIAAVHKDCYVSPAEEEQLLSPQSPIVILKKKEENLPGIAPENGNLGVLIPYSPLHHILMSSIKTPVVATSGNLSEETIVYENESAFTRLGEIADVFLIHNRPIARPLDDSVVRVMNQKTSLLRRARGHVPLPIQVPINIDPILAVGGHLKNTTSFGRNREILVSQHIGNLSNIETTNTFVKTMNDFSAIYQLNPKVMIHDKHPRYHSTEWACSQKIKTKAVQHHVAHFFSCMAEHQNLESALGVIWDGSGVGDNETIWGGEFFHWDGKKSPKHVANFRSFPLLGGDWAAKEPIRMTIGLLYEVWGNVIFQNNLEVWKRISNEEKKLFKSMLEKKINTPRGTSVGRIFDAIAGALNICNKNTYEGQAASMLEHLASEESTTLIYPFNIQKEKHKYNIDWAPMLEEILFEHQKNISPRIISARFHQTLAEMILSIAKLINEKKIFLSGGVFQNKVLLERTITLLEENKFEVYWHEKIPSNDGGISLGQVYYYAFMKSQNKDELCV